MITVQDLITIMDSRTEVLGSDGQRIGGVGQVYVHDATDTPSFVTVKTGLFGTRETFVPLDNATFENGQLRVPFTADQVKDAPQVDEGGSITPEDEDAIYAFYGMEGGVGGTTPSAEPGATAMGEAPSFDDVVQGDQPADPHYQESDAGPLDRDWSDSDGDGQRLERVDGTQDAQDGTFEGDGSLQRDRVEGEFDERIGMDRPTSDDALAAERDDAAFAEETRRGRLRRYEATASDEEIL